MNNTNKKPTGTENSFRPGISSLTGKLLAVLVLLLLWQLGAMAMNSSILLVSPINVSLRLWSLVFEPGFWSSVGFSLWRIALGFILSLVLGAVLAALSYKFSVIETLLWPLMAVIKATPVASIIILCLVWLTSSGLSAFIAFLMVLPVVYTGLLSGLRNTDEKLLETAGLFKFRALTRLRFLYMPAVRPYLLSACSVGLGLSWKAGVAAEIIGIPTGSIGEKLYEAKVYLSTPDLFAWTVVVIFISVLFEKLVLWLVRRLLYRQPSPCFKPLQAPQPTALSPLSCHSLYKSYGDTPVLNGLSHDFSEITAIMGPSGCGKTTLLRLIMDLEKPDGGSISEKPKSLSPMFQEHRLCEEFSALCNLSMVPGISEAQALKALADLGIEEPNKKISEYSGGMKQRVAIIRALLSPGELIILDEPFQGLDEKSLKQAAEFIAARRRGRRLIIVTHHIEDAALLSADILELKAK